MLDVSWLLGLRWLLDLWFGFLLLLDRLLLLWHWFHVSFNDLQSLLLSAHFRIDQLVLDGMAEHREETSGIVGAVLVVQILSDGRVENAWLQDRRVDVLLESRSIFRPHRLHVEVVERRGLENHRAERLAGDVVDQEAALHLVRNGRVEGAIFLRALVDQLQELALELLDHLLFVLDRAGLVDLVEKLVVVQQVAVLEVWRHGENVVQFLLQLLVLATRLVAVVLVLAVDRIVLALSHALQTADLLKQHAVRSLRFGRIEIAELEELTAFRGHLTVHGQAVALSQSRECRWFVQLLERRAGKRRLV